MNAADATRLAGDAYRTRLVRGEEVLADDQTRLVQEGYQSRLARDVVGKEAVTSESYALGERIGGRYEVSAIHHGELGVVYGCFDHETKLPRALKTVRGRYANDKQVLSLFESEAFVWVSLEKHPYIVRAYQVECFPGQPPLYQTLPYVITEYVRGPESMEGDLRGWLGHPRLTLPVAVTMALQIAQGMQHAVRKVPSLVHRDLKPANILVNSEGKAMVTDFGLVYAGQYGAGTPAYMSPEQWNGEFLDLRSDIYAYGCILFEMFTGHRLFPAMTEHEWERAHLAITPTELTSLVPQMPDEIDRFVRGCLEKNRTVRPQGWDEVVNFFAQWYHRLTGKAVVFDFSSLALNGSELFDSGYSLHNLRRYEEAIQAYDRAIAIDPNGFSVWNNKAIALDTLKRYEEAIHAYDQALANLRRYEEAVQAYDRAIAIDPNRSCTVWINKGCALHNLRRYEEAVQAYDRALAIDPNKSSVWHNKGIALGILERYEEEIQSYDRALAIDPNKSNTWINKGCALYNLKCYEEAIQAYDRALAIDPNNSVALDNKKVALRHLKRHEEIQASDRALAIDPNDLDELRKKGDALCYLGLHDDAIRTYDRALAINPHDSAVWSEKGFALGRLRRYEEAVQAYDRVLAIDPNDSWTWLDKGNALNNLKRYEEALHAYDRALTIDPNNSDAWNDKGNLLNNLERYEEALQAFGRALAIYPNDSIALEGESLALKRLQIPRSPWSALFK